MRPYRTASELRAAIVGMIDARLVAVHGRLDRLRALEMDDPRASAIVAEYSKLRAAVAAAPTEDPPASPPTEGPV